MNGTNRKAQAVARETLMRLLKHGSIIYTIPVKVTRSGMNTQMRVLIDKDGEIIPVTFFVSKAVGYSTRKGPTGSVLIMVNGIGRNLGQGIVDRLNEVLPLALTHKEL